MIRLWLVYDYDIQQIQSCNWQAPPCGRAKAGPPSRTVDLEQRVSELAMKSGSQFFRLAALCCGMDFHGFSMIFYYFLQSHPTLVQHFGDFILFNIYLTVCNQHRWSNFGAELANIAISSPQVGVQSSKRDVQKSMWYNPSPKNSIIYDKQLLVWNHALFG
jgi:hypothetical protein